MSKNKVIKPVAFNITKEDDARILNYLKRKKNFSGFAKKAMLDFISREESAKAAKIEAKEESKGNTKAEPLKAEIEQPEAQTAAEKLKAMKSMLKGRGSRPGN